MTTQQIYNTLLAEFPYFKKLEVRKRELLCKRTAEFIDMTKFIGKQNLQVTDKMKILIAACGQILTLSFKKNYLYNHFDRILIYPEKYVSPVSRTQNVGEMNTAGLIIFSWPDFYDGIKFDDNRNVGLHEYAHALEFMDIAQKETDKRFSYALDKEFMLAYEYIKNRGEENFFRSYAATNRAEFFAVATEYFFESSQAFSQAHPDIFALFCKLYGQDPRPSQVSFRPYPSAVIKELGKTIYDPILNVRWTGFVGLITFVVSLILPAVMVINGASVALLVFNILALIVSFGTSFLFSSFGLYEKGIKIRYGIWARIVELFIPGMGRKAQMIAYEDIFTISVWGDLENAEEFIKIRTKQESPPVMKAYYYDNGKIKSSSLSLSGMSYTMDKLEHLYLEKKVCVRINGPIKRFEL